MATTTILQYLETSGVSSSGATVQLGVSPLNRQQQETFLCQSAITAGQLVAVDVAQMATDASGGLTAATVITADFNSAPVQKIVVGVALESVTGTATAPAPIRVCVRGPVGSVSVPVVGATAVGDPLTLDPAGAAGSAAVNVAATITPVVAFALTSTPGAGSVNAYVLGLGI